MSAPTAISPLYVHRYLLRSGVALNSASLRREFPGALLRAGDGFGCIHPWPEFGDAPLDEQLERLARGELTPLTEIALRCAETDGAARRAGVSLFDGMEIPPSHYSWSFGQDTTAQLQRVLEEGWPAMKVKGFANWGETLGFLDSCARVDTESALRFRIDFNGCLEPHDFNKACELMPLRVFRRLDLIEDPTPYDAPTWEGYRSRWSIRLALDKGWKNGATGFDAVVVKPARRDWRAVADHLPGAPLMLTSAMDHGLGQVFAAYEAALANQSIADRLTLCGLCTQHLFAIDEFFERLRSPGGRLEPDRTGTGLGFDDILERLPWTRLT